MPTQETTIKSFELALHISALHTAWKAFSQSHHYAQLGNALQKTFCFHIFAYSALIIGTFKGSTDQFFNFSAQSQNFTGDLAALDFP